MNEGSLETFVNQAWEAEILPTLIDYIRIPNKSPAFDPDWAAHGHMDRAVDLFATWARGKIAKLSGATLEVVRLEGRTPLIFIEIPGAVDDTVLLYGHLDKQPEMLGWAEGTGPWEPVLKDDKLYGRGGADDGYAMFASLTALLALAEQGIAHARAVILIEACEESGSFDLPAIIDHLTPKIGTPSLVVCLDSGCGDYARLWLTTSLRGIASGTLSVRVLTEGVHSGDASGLVPSSFRILRERLSQIEDAATGAIKLAELTVDVPQDRRDQAAQSAEVLGEAVYSKMPFAGTTRAVSSDLAELVLNRTWRPQLAVTGMAGYPLPQDAGNVMLPYSAAKLSMRLPPTCNADAATQSLKRVLETDPPYGAEVVFTAEGGQGGWNAPMLEPWLEQAVSRASLSCFGKPPAYMGEGGSIPFMAMLGARYPATQFVVTGVLGPHSNAHGPNEFLHIPMAKKLTAAIAMILADHGKR
ncbi:MAG TPA: M20/M25/M40 family metallo-hydrolase [Rhizomicrobium sp.]|nr:M20/M25/M40 family metallo-hydrolase [Rhizomicrobium sp.]